MSLAGRVAMVTGAASGLGRATVVVLAGQGVKVVGVDRDPVDAAELDAEARRDGGTTEPVATVAVDLTTAAGCRQAVDAVVERHGRIDYLVNCAATTGRPAFVPSDEVEEALWDTVLDTNAKGTYFCCRYALPHMRSQKFGVIINVASIAAQRPHPRQLSYGASKAAVVHLTRTIAAEFFSDGIRANVILPGGMDTPMARLDEASQAMDLSGILMSPQAVAEAIALLCRDEAAVFFASEIRVDGGFTAIAEAGGLFQGPSPDAVAAEQ